MNYQDLCETIEETNRFLKKAKAAKKNFVKVRDVCFSGDGKTSGACLRASMDLTRKLAELRHPRRVK